MGTSHSKLWTICVPVSLHFIAFAYLWRKQRNQKKLEHLVFEKIGHVTGIFIYPVKSCKGISLESSNCCIQGLELDRCWIVVDKDFEYIRCSDKPVFSQVTPHFEDDGKTLCLDAPGMDTLRVNLHLDKEENYIEDLKVLRISSKSQYVGDEAAAWFSTLLNSPGCRMYQIYEPRYSMQDPKWGDIALPGDKTGYAAVSSYHIVAEASLVALNKELQSPVGMDRFRPNIVIGGTEPFAEDWPEVINCFRENFKERCWIVVDKDFEYIRCSDKPVFSQVTPHFEDDGKTLCLDAPGMDTLRVNLHLDKEENYIEDLKVLSISSKSQYVGDEAAAWFSTLLNSPGCRMYQIYEPRYSMQDTKWGDIALPGDKTGYAAVSSYHIAAEASLVALNKELQSPVGMDRFRPNIVIGDTEPFAEDHWLHRILKIADVKFRKLKDCGRCVQTTVDRERGKKDGLEPLSTLRRFRLFEDRDPRHGLAPYFGIQSAPDCEGTIKIGDPVFISC